MNFVNSSPTSMGSALFAAQRAADLTYVLLNKEQLDDIALLTEVNQTLKEYGEQTSKVLAGDITSLRAISSQLYTIFSAQDVRVAATLINTMLAEHASVPRLTVHANTPWHIHVDSSDHAPWAEWFASSSAFALAVLLAEKQRNPGGVCASATCSRPFIDTGKGGGRLYCSPRCATRERVVLHRKAHA
ncbi:MAG TPA: CGNR zinc finger domain-containing protein [Candidatus Saccharimonadales bacterium]|nr:CGNR zinc finger domain-containing protein [Candidatus Saccharimonadales bacterium]